MKSIVALFFLVVSNFAFSSSAPCFNGLVLDVEGTLIRVDNVSKDSYFDDAGSADVVVNGENLTARWHDMSPYTTIQFDSEDLGLFTIRYRSNNSSIWEVVVDKYRESDSWDHSYAVKKSFQVLTKGKCL